MGALIPAVGVVFGYWLASYLSPRLGRWLRQWWWS